MICKEIVLPQLRATFHVKHNALSDGSTACPLPLAVEAKKTQNDMHIVVAGGRAPSAAWLRSAAQGKAVYCADRGALYCERAGVVPTALYGDCDSTEAVVYGALAAKGCAVHTFPREKDDTDLQLVLKNLPQGDLLATGIWGGRFDHLYSNVYSLLNWKQQHDAHVVLADEQECMLLLTAGDSVTLDFAENGAVQALSLLPFSAQCSVSFDGVHWPLAHAELHQLVPYSISNVLEQGAESCSCTCHTGAVGFYICFKV